MNMTVTEIEIVHIITHGIQINRILLIICCLTASVMMGIASCTDFYFSNDFIMYQEQQFLQTTQQILQ